MCTVGCMAEQDEGFFKSAGSKGVAGVVATAVFLALGLFEHHFGKNVSGYYFFLLSDLFFMYGCYQAWATEHRKLLAERAKNLKPQFKANLHSVIRAMDPPNTVLVSVSVVNVSSADSSIRAFRLRHGTSNVIHKSTHFAVATTPSSQIHEDITINGDGVSTRMKRILTSLKSLSAGNKEVMWTQNAHKEGWLCFQGVDIPEDESECSMALEIEDAVGDIHRSVMQICPVQTKAVFFET
jgi:hypothetical protein